MLKQAKGPAQVLVIVARLCTTVLRRNHDVFAGIVQGIDDPFLGILSFVGNDRGCWRVGQ